MPLATTDRPTVQPAPRLVVTDMDGTLLDGRGRIPESFWPVLTDLRERGVTFAVASGRQYATLARLFARDGDGIAFIAENGGFVARDDEELSSSPLDIERSRRVVREVRALAERRNLGLVWCGGRTAYVERADAVFVDEVGIYYASLEVVDDLLQIDEAPVKLAVLDADGAEGWASDHLGAVSAPYRAVVSSPRWIDIMDEGVNKGVAVRALQSSLGVTADQTVAFGDYLNDLEMLDEARHSFAMANGHPDVLRRARHVAPANTEQGVVTTIERLLDATPERLTA